MSGRTEIPGHVLSGMIGMIYDCALDPELWPATLARLAELCDSPYCGLAVQDLVDAEGSCLIDHGYPRDYCSLSARMWNENPMTPSIFLLETGDVATLSMACDDEELFGSRFHREVQKPYDILDVIGLLALRRGNRIAYFHASRLMTAPRYGERDIELFRLLSPHLCRALAITDALDLKTLRSDMFEDVLDGLAAAVFLTDGHGRVTHMNRAAEALLREGTALRLNENRLTATDEHARATLASMITIVSGESYELYGRGHTMAMPDREGPGFIATLLPLGSGNRSGIMAAFAASVAVFVQNPSQAPPMPGEAFARLYRLTGGELRVLLALAQGLGATESAQVLGLSEATVRTHLRNIFAKTGTSRQVELLQLLQNSAAPVAVAG